MSYENILKVACEMEKSIIEHHELNEIEDYDGAYELEQDQRDMGLTLADAVINNFSDYDTLVDENEKMAKFIKSQGFDVDDVISFLYRSDNVL